jgi:hypothetical protein
MIACALCSVLLASCVSDSKVQTSVFKDSVGMATLVSAFQAERGDWPTTLEELQQFCSEHDLPFDASDIHHFQVTVSADRIAAVSYKRVAGGVTESIEISSLDPKPRRALTDEDVNALRDLLLQWEKPKSATDRAACSQPG